MHIAAADGGATYLYYANDRVQTVTDGRGATQAFSYNNRGLASVTGTGYAAGGATTQFATNYQHRAWGGLRARTNGDGTTVSLGYDARMQVASYTAPNWLTRNYQRYADGRLRFADGDDARYDRYFEYDQAGRLAVALTGTQARGGTEADGPYRQSYAYDAWNNLTFRESIHWTANWTGTQQTYTNDRNQQWTYDAAGHLLNDQQRQYTFDAAGRMRSFDTFNLYHHDGDGQMVRTDRADEWPVYFLRSTVLGGAVVSEIRPMGTNNWNNRKDLIYAQGGVLAIHSIYGAQGGDAQAVTWEYRDAESLSLRSPGYTELDPLGGEVGLENHYGEGGGLYVPSTDETSPSYPMLGNPIRPYSGCTLDGMPVSCSELRQRMEAGAVASETLIHDGNRWRVFQESIRSYGLGLFSTYLYRVDEHKELGAYRHDFAFKTEGPPNTYDPRADFRDYAKKLSNDRSFTNDCLKLALLIYKAGQVWGADGSDSIVTGLLSGLTEFSSIGYSGTTPSDPNFRVGVLRNDPNRNYAASFGQRGFNGSYDGGGFINPFPDNQVRHFVGWFAAGYSTNLLFAEAALFLEEGTLRNRDPDVALGRAAISLGRSFRGDFRQLAQDVWRRICGENSRLTLP